MFESFVHRPSYAAVKAFWDTHPNRRVQSHAVESWKATFEEFGLLYVPKASGNVIITPGGHQLVAAATAAADREFAWIGLNLLLRYPLRGTEGRSSRGDDFDRSDLLLYWFLYAALIELEGFWKQELFRVLASVFRRSDAPAAIQLVRRLRAGEADIVNYPDPSAGQTGAVYNALNQVLVHGSLNHMIFSSAKDDSPYLEDTRENWWFLRDQYRDVVQLALGDSGAGAPSGCAGLAPLIDRMPAAPNYGDEQDYFDHVGAPVPDLAEAEAQAAEVVPTVEYGGESVVLLTAGIHFSRRDDQHVVGSARTLCRLGQEHRVLVSDNLDLTFMVEHKELAGNDVVVRLRRARPILDRDYVESLYAGDSSV
jgi:hypothetical protein